MAGSVEPQAFEPDARARAILRGVEAKRASLAAAGGAYDLGQVRALLNGISRQAVEKRVREGGLLAVPGPGNRRAYPTVQFTPDGAPVPGLKAVRAALGDAGPWSVLSFLLVERHLAILRLHRRPPYPSPNSRR